MARGIVFRLLRRLTGSFAAGELSAGEVGVTVASKRLAWSTTGSDINEGPLLSETMVVVKHGADGNVARPTGATVVWWIGTATPANAATDDHWSDTT